MPEGISTSKFHVGCVESMGLNVVAGAKDFIAPLEHAWAEDGVLLDLVLVGEAELVGCIGGECLSVDQRARGGAPSAVDGEPVLGNSLRAVPQQEQATQVFRVRPWPQGDRHVRAEVQCLTLLEEEWVEAEVSVIVLEPDVVWVDVELLVNELLRIDSIETCLQGCHLRGQFLDCVDQGSNDCL